MQLGITYLPGILDYSLISQLPLIISGSTLTKLIFYFVWNVEVPAMFNELANLCSLLNIAFSQSFP